MLIASSYVSVIFISNDSIILANIGIIEKQSQGCLLMASLINIHL